MKIFSWFSQGVKGAICGAPSGRAFGDLSSVLARTMQGDSMADDVILIEDRERVRYLTINRPEKRNAITVDQLGQLIDTALDAAGDPSIGAVVIRGEGKAFCAGIDIDPAQMDMQ